MERVGIGKIVALVLLPLMLGGCGFSAVSEFFNSEKSCSAGTTLERASCLTKEYRAICKAGEFGLRDNLNRLRKITNNDIGTRVCKKRIAITIGPIINGASVTGTLLEQSDKTETQCYQSFNRDRILCNARVKLHFLSRQFKAACLATIPWYTANDLMFKTVELRERTLAAAKIKGNHIYRADKKWLCHKNTRVSGLHKPRLKRVYAEPNNKMVLAVFKKAQNACSPARKEEIASSKPHTMSYNLACVLPKAVKNLGQEFTSVCKGKDDKKVKDKALADVVHARKFLAMLHPEHFQKSRFVWLCGKHRIFVKSSFVFTATKAVPTSAKASPQASDFEAPEITMAIPPSRNTRKNLHWKSRKIRARTAGLKQKRRRTTQRNRRKANRPRPNAFSYENATF